MVRIRSPVGCAAAGDGPGVDGVGETERARFGVCVATIATVDRSGRLDGPAIGVSRPGGLGFNWGRLSLSYRKNSEAQPEDNQSETHFRCLPTSLKSEFVTLHYHSF